MPNTPDTAPVAAARTTAALLLLAGVVAGLAATVGVASPDVPGTLGAVPAAAWIALLPGLIAAVVVLINPVAGLAAVAAAGIAAVVRLLPNLSVLVQPEAVARPELFYPTSGRAFPIDATFGGVLLLLADLLALAAGVLAARALARSQDSGQYAARHDADPVADAAADAPADGHRPTRNLLMISLGFVAVALLGIAGSGQLYSGGFVAARMSVPGTDFGSLFAPFVLVIVAIVAVLVAATLPRAMSLAVVGGAAAALVVPALIGLAVAASDAPVEVSGTVWMAIVGAVLLVGTGAFTRVRSAGADGPAGENSGNDDDAAGAESEGPDESAVGTRLRILAGVSGTVAGVLVTVGSLLPLLLANGAADTPDESGYTNDATVAPSLLAAGILLLVAGVVVLSGFLPGAGRVGRIGRAVLVVGWAAPLWPLAEALSDLGRFQSGTRAAEELATQLGDPSLVVRWQPGAGFALAVIGVLLTIAAAVISAVSLSKDGDEEQVIVDDESAELSHRRRWQLAGLLAVLAIVGLGFGLYTSGAGTVTPHAQPGLFAFDTGTVWGCWMVLLAVLVALAVAASTRYVEVAVGSTAAAAVVVALRQMVPAAESAAVRFESGPGLITGWLLAGLLLIGAGVMAQLAAGIRPASGEDLGSEPDSGTGSDMGSAPHVEELRKPIAPQ